MATLVLKRIVSRVVYYHKLIAMYETHQVTLKWLTFYFFYNILRVRWPLVIGFLPKRSYTMVRTSKSDHTKMISNSFKHRVRVCINSK